MKHFFTRAKKIFFVIPFVLIFFHMLHAEDDGPGAWTQSLSSAGPIWSVAVNPTNQQIMYAASNTLGIYKTTNGGVTWTQMNSGITNTALNVVAVSPSSPNTVYCGGGAVGISNGMYKSTDAGATWTAINTGITQTPNCVQEIAVSPTDANTVYISLWDGGTTNATDGLYKTINGGTLWTAANTGMGANKNILCVAVNPSNPNTVYCGTSFLQPNPPGTGPAFVYKSVNAGVTWTTMSTGLPSAATDINPIRHISISTADTSVAILSMFYNTATPNAGVYLTTNGGTSWTQRSTGFPNAQATLVRGCLIKPGSNTEFYAGVIAPTGGIYRTTDAGLSWTNFNGGPVTATSIIRSIAFRTSGDSTVYIANSGTAASDQGVFEYSWIPVGIHDPNLNIPSEFALHQNYPNPFNPNTLISFALPKAGYVSVKVYDITGKEIKTLVNEIKQAGIHNISFDGSGLASGVYFYKLTSGDFTATNKMILTK